MIDEIDRLVDQQMRGGETKAIAECAAAAMELDTCRACGCDWHGLTCDMCGCRGPYAKDGDMPKRAPSYRADGVWSTCPTTVTLYDGDMNLIGTYTEGEQRGYTLADLEEMRDMLWRNR